MRRRRRALPRPPSDPHFGFRAVYDIGVKSGPDTDKPYCTLDFASPAASLGITHVANAIPDATAVTALEAKSLKSGGWWLGSWDNTDKVFSKTELQVTNSVNAVKATTAGSDHYYTVCDEPRYSSEFVAALATRLATIRAADPLAVCTFADYTYSGRLQYGNWASETTIDEIWIDGYAVYGVNADRGNPGAYDSTVIPYQLARAAEAQAIRPALRFKGVIAAHNDVYSVVAPDVAYSGVNARIPSFPGATLATATADNQLQEQVDAYRASSVVSGIVAFAYAPYPETGPPSDWTGYLRNRPDLQAELASQFLRP